MTSERRRKNYKWLLPASGGFNAAAEKIFWQKSHGDNNYEDIYSVTEDAGLRARIVSALRKHPDLKKILIPGCGTRGFLERDLALAFPAADIVCVDFPVVVDIAAAHNTNPRISYIAADCTQLSYDEIFDAVIVINATVSDDDATNRDILASCHAALKQGGSFIGLFPTIFAALDITLSSQDTQLAQIFQPAINLPAYRLKDPVAGTSQIFYGPLLLNLILKEAGFGERRMEICFFDSDFLTAQAAKMYGLHDPDMTIYEFFVTAHKRPEGASLRPLPAQKTPKAPR